MLNADGSPDAAFNAGAGATLYTALGAMVAQADGKIIITGYFNQFAGQSAGRIIRLNANGSIDNGFQTGTGLNRNVYAMVLQADGKILLGGEFTTVSGQAVASLVRLSSTGTIDATFNAQASPNTVIAGLALQPDGRLLVALNSGSLSTHTATVQRLQPSGSWDATFQLDPTLMASIQADLYSPAATPLCVLFNGSIMLACNGTSSTLGSIRLARITAGGTLDPTFSLMPNTTTEDNRVNTIQVLATGQLLVAGTPSRFGRAPEAPVPVALLTTSGLRDPGFAPNVQWSGVIESIATQTDGKLIVAGLFNEINGVAAHNVARLNSNGVVDGIFTMGGADDRIHSVVIQPDGKILLAGSFVQVNGSPQPSLARLLPTGNSDLGFVPSVATFFFPGIIGSARYGTVLPNGQVVVGGSIRSSTNTVGQPESLLRLDGVSGQRDVTFQPAAAIVYLKNVLVQPDGKLLLLGTVAVNNQPHDICRLLANGVLDASFTLPPYLPSGSIDALALDAAGRIYLAGVFSAYGTVNTQCVARLLSTGLSDPTFASTLPLNNFTSIRALAVQPNGRILLGGTIGVNNQIRGSARLLRSCQQIKVSKKMAKSLIVSNRIT